MRLYELIIQDENIDEVFAISMVDNPAIEAFGTYFHKEEVQFAEMKEEGLFIAPILIPNKRILRVDGSGVPYEVYFSPETIKRLSQMYLEKKYQDSVTLEHDMKVDGITLVESWLVESASKDKSALYNLKAPVGSWVGTFKIDNEEMKEKFRKGEVRAVSIEGVFEHMERTPKEQLQSAVLMESFADFMEKDVEELSEIEASLVLSKIREAISNKEHLQAQPSIVSSYPGEASSGSIAEETLAELPEMNIYGYETEYFYICPGAVGTFQAILEEEVDDDVKDMVRAAAVFADMVFDIEEDVLEDGVAKEEDLRKAEVLVAMFKDVFQTVSKRLGKDFDISYMDGHIEVIKKYLV